MADPAATIRLHATALACAGRAALIRGPSGSGKSDLALRALALPPFAPLPAPLLLLADDHVLLEPRDGRLIARCPPAIAGLIEVRGLGLVRLPSIAEAQAALVVDLVPPDAVERLPEPRHVELGGVRLPLLSLSPFEASAPVKLALALAVGPARDG